MLPEKFISPADVVNWLVPFLYIPNVVPHDNPLVVAVEFASKFIEDVACGIAPAVLANLILKGVIVSVVKRPVLVGDTLNITPPAVPVSLVKEVAN